MIALTVTTIEPAKVDEDGDLWLHLGDEHNECFVQILVFEDKANPASVGDELTMELRSKQDGGVFQ